MQNNKALKEIRPKKGSYQDIEADTSNDEKQNETLSLWYRLFAVSDLQKEISS